MNAHEFSLPRHVTKLVKIVNIPLYAKYMSKLDGFYNQWMHYTLEQWFSNFSMHQNHTGELTESRVCPCMF
jgi:hypothetical protein